MRMMKRKASAWHVKLLAPKWLIKSEIFKHIWSTDILGIFRKRELG